MSLDDLTWLTIDELGKLIRDRKVSPVEIVQHCLSRIERLDGILRNFITLTGDSALQAARVAEAEIGSGRYRGPLHGIPVAHKDVYCTAGVRTTAHSRLFESFIPDRDAAVVSAWAEAGAISLGKLNTYELASGREMRLFGIPRNPWRLDRVTGGSSCGSGGALAAGLLFGASGTDGGGSIRAPAALCGVVGFRPTFGLVSRFAALSSGGTVTCCGPLARSVIDIAHLLQPLAAHDPRDAYSRSRPAPAADYATALGGDLTGLRVGVPRHYFLEPDVVAPDVYRAVCRAIDVLGELGAEIQHVDLPAAHLCDALYEALSGTEYGLEYHDDIVRRPTAFDFSTRVHVEAGVRVTAVEYLQAQQLRALVQREFMLAFEQVDVIVAPTANQTAQEPAADAKLIVPHPRRPLSLPGGPVISVPCGLGDDGLPIGLQIAGRPWEEETVLRAAWAYEQSQPRRSYPDVSEAPPARPLEMPTTSTPVEQAVEERLTVMRRSLAEASARYALDDVAPAVRFRV